MTTDLTLTEALTEINRLRAEITSTRTRAIIEERKRIIGAVEEAIGRGVCDGGQYRADIKSAIDSAFADLRAQLAEAEATLANERERVLAMLVRRAEGHEAHLRAHPNAGSISRRSHKCRADECRVMADLISRAAMRAAAAAVKDGAK